MGVLATGGFLASGDTFGPCTLCTVSTEYNGDKTADAYLSLAMGAAHAIRLRFITLRVEHVKEYKKRVNSDEKNTP